MPALSFIKQLANDFVSLIYPELCLGCQSGLGPNEAILCVTCRVKLPVTNFHLETEQPLMLKFQGKVPVAYALAYLNFTKEGTAQKLVHQIKYRGHKETGERIGYWYGEELNTNYAPIREADFVVGVPLHKSRLQQRGYNQADWIGKGLAEGLGKPFHSDVLVRNQYTGSQTRRSRLERYKNVDSVFAVAKYADVLNKHIVIADDVLTTGATIEACARVLFDAGCQTVGVITIAATR